jgi:pyruvate,water dikinase
MIYTRDFSSISIKDSAIVGGKGASLGEMFNSGIPVPDGFVVSAKTFEDFLRRMSLVQEIDAIYKKINHRMISSVESASEKIQGLIKRATVPNDIIMEIITRLEILGDEFVAVRSSATAEDGKDHAWAGQLIHILMFVDLMLLKKYKTVGHLCLLHGLSFIVLKKGLATP